MLSWKQRALPVITSVALWQLMQLGTWCTIVQQIKYLFNILSILVKRILFKFESKTDYYRQHWKTKKSTIPHKFWDQSPSPNDQCCLQVSETVSWYKLRCSYSSNILQHWVEGSHLIYFCKVGHSRIPINFSGNWLGLNNLC